MFRLLTAGLLLFASSGCVFMPTVTHKPSVHNPFPQLSRVAVAPFFNLSTEAGVDGRAFAQAYFSELQSVPGYEVVPVGVVERTLEAYQIQLTGPEDARRLAQLLNVDAVVIGAVTDYSPYYPPRCAMQVEWYASNPCYHPIPPGYGLPWGTTEEEQIPSRLIFEAEMALAREQMKTQTPPYEEMPPSAPPPQPTGEPVPSPDPQVASPDGYEGQLVDHEGAAGGGAGSDGAGDAGAEAAALAGPYPGLPPDWPDPRGFTPRGPSAVRPECIPTNEPVLRHTNTYDGANAEVTEALSTYYYFRDDARFGGWQAYLQRSSDFIRFCCHAHISEMLTARGGAGETQVVWRWPIRR